MSVTVSSFLYCDLSWPDQVPRTIVEAVVVEVPYRDVQIPTRQVSPIATCYYFDVVNLLRYTGDRASDYGDPAAEADCGQHIGKITHFVRPLLRTHRAAADLHRKRPSCLSPSPNPEKLRIASRSTRSRRSFTRTANSTRSRPLRSTNSTRRRHRCPRCPR